MDSREDEQRRGITMKSSSIALGYKMSESEALNIVNLIDSPGHVDFSGEVEAALRICDGALLVVDVVEGVCVQTVTVLRAALEHAVRPVLVLNKLDRLFGELHLGPMEAYEHIVNVLAQVNVIMGVKEVEEMMAAASVDDGQQDDCEWKLEDKTHDRTVSGYFSPEQGNVVFASALDGWAFRIIDFARLISKKFGISEAVLNRTLWGDYFLQSKTKRIVRKKPSELKTNAKPMFVQFILSNIHAIYDTILCTQHDLQLAVEKRQNFVDKLGLKVTSRDLKHRDASIALHAIMNAWLPAASCLMDTIVEKLPSALEAQSDMSRLNALWPNVQRATEVEKVGNENASSGDIAISFQNQLKFLSNADVEEGTPVIATVSKMIEGHEEKGDGGQMNIRTPKTREELRASKEIALREKERSSNGDGVKRTPMIAFARILCGTLSLGDAVFVYGPKYQVAEDGTFDPASVAKASVSGLHLLMGRGTDPLKSASAGTVVGISGLEDVVLKTATVSTAPPGLCLPAGITSSATLGLEKDAVMKVAVEPHLPRDVEQLREGLRLLNQADPAVETFISAKGEHVIAANGELHLERCLKDLRERFAKGIRIHVSKPIVSFRETVCGGTSPNVKAPTLEEVSLDFISQNELDGVLPSNATEGSQRKAGESRSQESGIGWGVRILPNNTRMTGSDTAFIKHGRIIKIGNDGTSLRVTAAPLPLLLASVLEEFATVLRKSDCERTGREGVARDVEKCYREKLTKAVEEHAQRSATRKQACDAIRAYWLEDVFTRVWSSGPGQCGSNLLIGPYESATLSRLQSSVFGRSNVRTREWSRVRMELEKAVVTGFQLGTRAGPLCEEPLHGVAIFIDSIQNTQADGHRGGEGEDVDSLTERNDRRNSSAPPQSTVSGLLIGSMKEAVRLAVMHGNPRLMEGVLRVDITVPDDSLGKTYTVLGQRRGRVLKEDMKEGVHVFGIEALLPVQDSFGFTDLLRKQTSGFAVPQMVFSHWEVIEIDPFWFPQTEEELEDLGAADTTAENNNLARKLINSVRRRKGLRVEEKIVESAEKQRTLSRKK